jgi:hypothetical protein
MCYIDGQKNKYLALSIRPNRVGVFTLPPPHLKQIRFPNSEFWTMDRVQKAITSD